MTVEDTVSSPNALFEIFAKIIETPSLSHLHDTINDARQTILDKCTNETLPELIQLASVSNAAQVLKNAFVKMNHERVKIILDTKKIPADHGDLAHILKSFAYPGNDSDICKMVKLLIDYGFDRLYDSHAIYRYTVLLGGDYVQTVEMLLDSGLSVEEQVEGVSLVQYAAQHKRFNVVELLIKRGANTDNLNKTELPEHLQKMLEGPKTLVQIQHDKIAQLQEQIATVTSVANFKRCEFDIVDIYHKFVNQFVSKYNTEHSEVVLSFNGDTSVLTVTKAATVTTV